MASAGLGTGQLPDGMGTAPQAAASHGASRSGPNDGRCRGGRNILGQRGKGRCRAADGREGPDCRGGGGRRGGHRASAAAAYPGSDQEHPARLAQAVEPGSTVRTDGLNAYRGLEGYRHDRHVQRAQSKGEHLLPRVHRVVALLKRWMLGTHHGAIGHAHLDYYLDKFTFRFTRRKSALRGKLFYRLVQQAVQVEPVPLDKLLNHNA